ncbi:tRNA pseudouridine(38-40) synthase TruA [Advenella sp. S44]|uniref:tRNA pseudouridine(38-40) synthase TruA n=1 Tax=Advenella sp. S44 TaxID=1982755 RepID=UPI000C2B0FAC|nr:tRNA pseudouridine(38-40) synthase TruA [Advenella sp. S44]PJX22991.1 tRNA pseudouridine(38-40) synthase TruA [Advenella sp. S44]
MHLTPTLQADPDLTPSLAGESASRRIALGIAYNGKPYLGWQTQPGGRTVQDTLEKALAAFTCEATPTICAGRTDTGVHARAQVVHINTAIDRRMESWVRGVNAHLPPDITVRWARQMPDDFHSRFSATSRTYVYLLRNERILSPHWHGRAGWDFHPLDLDAMQMAARHLIGQHDFSSFRSSQCQAASPVRIIEHLSIVQQGTFFIFTLKANAFLHHMVRNILGCLLYVGKGRYRPDWIVQVLAERDRKVAAPTFMADGLYFAQAHYPAHFGLEPLDAFDISNPLQALLIES